MTVILEKPKPLNYKLTFCHITLASRIFSRNNYFPLFRVMTPKDARRRLLRKLQGPMEHYIPVLLNHKRRERLSKGKRVKLAPNYGKRPHKVDEDFRYVTAKFDLENDKHRRLVNLIKTKRRLKGKFAYTVIERDTVVVVNGQMEDTIRDGDINDIMISDFSDKIIVRFKTGGKVIVPIEDWDGPMQFVEGEGYTTKETEDKHHYGKSTMGLAQIYEMKEKGMDDVELERLRVQATKKAKLAQLEIDTDVIVKKEMKVVLDNLDYADDFDEYEEEMKKLKQKMQETQEAARALEAGEDLGGASGSEGEGAGEGEAGGVSAHESESEGEGGEHEGEADRRKSKAERSEGGEAPEGLDESDSEDEDFEIPAPTVSMTVGGDMNKTSNVSTKLVDAGLEVLGKLPTINEMNDVVRQLGEGKPAEIADVSGIVVQVGDKEKFLVGQMVQTETGDTFVPGQTVQMEDGRTSYMPGMTVNVDETPTFIAGLIMANEQNEAVFLPGQSLITEEGQLKFADEGEHMQPQGMTSMDVELDVNDVSAEDEERKIAKRLAEEEARREELEKERIAREKKRREEEKREREEAARKKKEEEDKLWAKLGAAERAKKERLRIEREKREAEKLRKEELEREREEKERQEKAREERAKLRAEREEIERQRMEKMREQRKKAREEARRRAEKIEAENRKKEEQKQEEERVKAAAAKAIKDAEEDERLAKLAEFIPVDKPRKEIIVDVEKEAETLNMKKDFFQQEMKRMQRIREIRKIIIPKIIIPKIEKYVPFPPIIISEKLKEMQKLIHSGNFFVDHRKYLPKLTQRLRVRFYNRFQDDNDFRELKHKYMLR